MSNRNEHNHCHDECCHEHEHHHEHGDNCSCGHDHEHESSKLDYIRIGFAAILLALSFLPFIKSEIVLLIMLIFSALLSGCEVFIEGIKGIFKGKIGEQFLLLIAVISAFAIGESKEAAAVSLFFAIGEIFEGLASEKSQKSLEKLSEIRSDKANIFKEDGTYESVDASEIKPGDKIFVLPHERIPVDCTVLSGESSIDTSAVTGESIPVNVYEGEEVLSGTLNMSGSFSAVALQSAENSAASRIIELAKNSSANKGQSEKLITRFARIYTPVVIVIGVLLALIPSLITGDWTKWIKSGLVFIVASCPCALVISIPLGFFSGIGLASKNGVIIKGGKYIEALASVKAAVFDKTGTLTDEKFNIVNCITFGGFTKEELKTYASAAESGSDHPLARAIVDYCGKTQMKIDEVNEYSGEGTKVLFENKTVLCGSKRLMEKNGVDISQAGIYPVYVAVDGKLAGAFDIEGNIRSDSVKAVKKLRELDINKIFMLTGDNEKSASYIAHECNIDKYYAELLPGDKIERFEEIRKEYGKTLYVGDGINDAPVLGTADAGVAMGLGSDAAIESADVVLVSGNLSDLCKAVVISRKTMNVVKFNIVFALAVKFIILLLALFGMAFMWMAVFADVGVSLIAIINSSRLLSYKFKRD